MTTKDESPECRCCKNPAAFLVTYQMGEFDDWGQRDYYCEEHIASHLPHGCKVWRLNEMKQEGTY